MSMMDTYGGYQRPMGYSSGGYGQRNNNPWRDAQKANERRYKDIMRLLKQRRSNAMGQIGKMGKAGMDEINRNFTDLGSSAMQDLTSRGLSGSTVSSTVQSGITRDKGSAIGQLQERLAGLRAQYESDLTGDLAMFMERRDDPYPAAYVGYDDGMGRGRRRGSRFM